MNRRRDAQAKAAVDPEAEEIRDLDVTGDDAAAVVGGDLPVPDIKGESNDAQHRGF